MGAPGGIAIGSMWVPLPDKDPGHIAAASDLAIDVVDRKLKKAAPVKVEAPPARTVAKPAKRGDKASRSKNNAARNSKRQAANVYDGKVQISGAGGDKQAANVCDGEVQINCTGGDKKTAAPEMEETLAALPSEEHVEEEEAKEEVITARGGRRPTVTVVAEGVTVATGTNMWGVLGDDDPGNVVDDPKQGKLAAAVASIAEVEEAPPADNNVPVGAGGAKPAKRDKKTRTKKKNGADGDSEQAADLYDGEGQMQIDGNVNREQTAAPATVPDGCQEIEETLAALPSEEEAEVEEAKEEMFDVVTARGGRRRTVATHKAAVVAEGTTVITGTNMWDLLGDNDPGHGDAKPAKRGKKNKTKKKKKNAAGGSNKAAATVDDQEETPASELGEEMPASELEEQTPASEFEEETSEEEEEEMIEEVVTFGSRCRTAALKAALAVGMLALFQLVTSSLPSLYT